MAKIEWPNTLANFYKTYVVFFSKSMWKIDKVYVDQVVLGKAKCTQHTCYKLRRNCDHTFDDCRWKRPRFNSFVAESNRNDHKTVWMNVLHHDVVDCSLGVSTLSLAYVPSLMHTKPTKTVKVIRDCIKWRDMNEQVSKNI